MSNVAEKIIRVRTERWLSEVAVRRSLSDGKGSPINID